MTDRPDQHRRRFLQMAAKTAASAAALAAFPPAIRRALALSADTKTGTIMDVNHIVILMLENRSFDHYFGTLRGVRGFGDRHPLPLASGKPVWNQSDGNEEVPPFHLDTRTTSALRAGSTPHSFDNAQAAWNQGKFGFWPKFKTPLSMGHYHREDIPFQFALAEAFTLCDSYHCSVTTGTDPNRIVFWSGSNFSPEHRGRGENCTDAESEPDNQRCWIEGALPTPGYTYKGSAFNWPTIPEVLEKAGVSWRIYQDPNDNWTGLMHGGLAFSAFRNATPGSSLYEKGMSHWSLERLAQDVQTDQLPQVSWILPTKLWSEHPAPSSSVQGAEFTSRVLESLTSNPEVWGRTAFFVLFDENDGLFDHVPAPAPPSYNPDGTLAGKATFDLRGEYFSDPSRHHLLEADTTSGTLRPWGLGPRVPFYVVSPWTRGGWVNSQVFDHTSVARFLETRFAITVPAISPWHRAVCGDLTSVFDFARPNETPFPQLPYVENSAAVISAAIQRPQPRIPSTPEQLFQEPGMRRSRALPYELGVHAHTDPQSSKVSLAFHNSGSAGAVLHVYDKMHLDRIPRRYTIEAGKKLEDAWLTHADNGSYDLWVYGPNGFLREFRGELDRSASARPEAALEYDAPSRSIRIVATNFGRREAALTIRANAYRTDGPWSVMVPPGRQNKLAWSVIASHHWYDLTVSGERFERRFAGRMETGAHSFSDPAV